MRAPRILLYEGDAEMAEQLRVFAEGRRWTMRSLQGVSACLNELANPSPTVVVVKLARYLLEKVPEGTDAELAARVDEKRQRRLTRLFTLLDRASRQAPDVPLLLVSDWKLEETQARNDLACLAYELGATFVLSPPLIDELLIELVQQLMEQAIQRCVREPGGCVANSPN
jgi:hypothetical protein